MLPSLVNSRLHFTHSALSERTCQPRKSHAIPLSAPFPLANSLLFPHLLISFPPYFLFSVPSSKFRIPQILCLPLLRKLPGGGGTRSFLRTLPARRKVLLLARIGLALPTSVKLLCYANHETTHEPRIRFTHRQNSRHPHLSPLHLGLHFCSHNLHDRLAIQAGTSALDRHPALDRRRPDQPPLFRLSSVPRTLPQHRGPALQDSRCFHHSLSLRWPGAHRARTFQGHSGIQHRDCRT